MVSEWQVQLCNHSPTFPPLMLVTGVCAESECLIIIIHVQSVGLLVMILMAFKSGLMFQDAFEFFSNLTDQLDEILKVSCLFWGKWWISLRQCMIVYVRNRNLESFRGTLLKRRTNFGDKLCLKSLDILTVNLFFGVFWLLKLAPFKTEE